ncbi:MAG: hypothetical protein K2X64_07115, partial [Rhodocyclaceae bacterium]|nr:hypothetical protein [Rhodocyclaceae bacterium]
IARIRKFLPRLAVKQLFRVARPQLPATLAREMNATVATSPRPDACPPQLPLGERPLLNGDQAAELARLSGEPMSAIYARQEREVLPYRRMTIALMPTERAWLHERIAQRFDEMLAQGLVEETVSLRKKYALHGDMPSMRCVGYRQVWDMLEDKIPPRELRDRGIFATRQFAKRQITWLNSLPNLTLFDCLKPALAETIHTNVQNFLDPAS